MVLFQNSLESPSVDHVTICESEHKIYSETYKGCNNSEEGILEITCDYSLEEFFTTTNHEDVHNEYDLCLVNLNKLSCDEINAIKTKDDFKNIEGCLVYQDVKKSETCYINVNDYCNDLFDTCGKDSLYGVCSTSYHEYVDDEGKDKKEFKRDNIRAYCDEATNKDEKADFTDLFTKTCENYMLACSPVVELDFRNDDWKTQCIQE